MINRALRKFREALHLAEARKVLQTPPIVPTKDRVVLYSMIGTKTLIPYLVAVKSLHARLKIGRIAVLDDGTLTTADKALLVHHCGNPKIYSIHEVQTGVCPTGGTWERLLLLLEITSEDYVIQVDSDTLTMGDVPEVIEAIAANRNFSLLGDPMAGEHGVLSLPSFMAAYYPQGSGIDPAGPAHVQRTIEGNWDRYPNPDAHYYVRGCSGFAGFASNGIKRSAAETFSQNAEAIVGYDKWRNWGSEQVASNFLIANSGNAVLLPYDRYSNYWNEAPGADTRFLHFVGTHRYSTSEYRMRTRQVIATL